MRVLVCVKYVPDIHSPRSFAHERVVRNADDGGLNELDEHAVEAAVRLVEDRGGEVIAATMGVADATVALRRALQLGATRAIRVSDDALAGSDVFGTARVLAAAIRRVSAEEPLDLVVTGMASLDGLTSMLPSALAAELGWAQLTLASSLEVADGRVRVERHLADARETVEAPMPAVVSVTDEANKPRYPNFKAIVAAREVGIEELGLADLGIDPATVGDAGARVRVVSAEPRPPSDSRVVVSDTGDGGEQLAAFLAERGFA
jgi:electron transfer flavoprotein beta subunit